MRLPLSSARPYIALLAQQKIVSGDNQGNFNPKNTLNRSETAVLVSNLYTLLVNSASAPETPSEPVEAAKLEGKIGGMTNFYIKIAIMRLPLSSVSFAFSSVPLRKSSSSSSRVELLPFSSTFAVKQNRSQDHLLQRKEGEDHRPRRR